MKNDIYYWIKVGGIVHKYIPMFRNFEGYWCYDQLSTRVFISDYKLQLLHGKDCIVRPVDFVNDITDWDEANPQRLEYFTVPNGGVFLGSKYIFYYHTACTWEVNRFENTKVLTFK